MKPLRRSSSNGVRDLLAIFEGGSSTSATSTTTRGPTTRRVTSSFVPVEPVEFAIEKRLSSAYIPAMSLNMSHDMEFGPGVDRSACLDLTLQQYLDQDTTKYQEVVIAAALMSGGPNEEFSVLLVERSDNGGHFELLSSRVTDNDGPIWEALKRTIADSTGGLNRQVVARIPDIEYAKQETIVSDDGSEKVDAKAVVQITYVVTVPTPSSIQARGEYKSSRWVTMEDVQGVQISEPMGQAVQDAFEYSKAHMGRAGEWDDMNAEKESKDLDAEEELESQETGMTSTTAQPTLGPPTTLETAGQYDGLPDQDGNGFLQCANDAFKPDGDVVVIPNQNGETVDKDKNVSTAEDEEARLLPADVEDAATFAAVQTNGSAGEEENEPIIVQSSVNDSMSMRNGSASTNGHTTQDSDQPTSSTQRLSGSSSSTRATQSSSSKVLTSKSASKTKEVARSTAPKPTITNGKTRGPEQTTSTQRTAKVPALRKSKSPNRTARIPSDLSAPTASSSAKTENSSIPTGTTSSRIRRLIEGTPHFLSSTAASVAKKDIPHGSESTKSQALPIRHAESTKRDRTSIASTSNSTLRKPITTQYRSSLQPTNGTTNRPAEPRVSTSENGPKATNGDFLARMTRPTAASSGKSLEKSEVKHADQSGTVRGKPRETTNGTVSKRPAVAAIPAPRQVLGIHKQNVHTGMTHARTRPNVNGKKEQKKSADQTRLLTTSSSLPSLQASPNGNGVEVEEADMEVDAAPGMRENGVHVGEEDGEGAGENVKVEDVAEADDKAMGHLEARVMESLEIGGEGVGVIR